MIGRLLATMMLAASLLLALPVSAADSQNEEAAIRAVFEQMGQIARLGVAADVTQVLAPSLELDYSHWFGDEVELVSRSELVTEFDDFLPGLNLASPAIEVQEVSISGNRASAVVGCYQFSLQKNATNWQITAVTAVAPTAGSRSKHALST
ncbi:hypothetical protein GCM10011369_34760 [Neiella marina]|uniref:Nuclear transport factor 2 family protein n=1 Tax=Neiella marina TaxID=508461 RepID=A0A8J2XS59_9GAMM|nr:hypothetical protein [Neiella marina]GGA89609.1 hypothetical protein GCM10011369_34760 [Neiella marina]